MKHLSLKLSRRILSLLVAAVIVLSGIPVTAADENLPAGYEYATSGVTAGDNGAENSDPNVDEADAADTDEQEPAPDGEADAPVATPATTSAPIGIAPTAAPSGGTISEDTEWTMGTLFGNLEVEDGVTLTIKGKLTISGNVKISGGGTLLRGFGSSSSHYLIEVGSSASLTLENITVDGNGSNYSGGSLVYVNGGTFDMYDDAVLCNNKTAEGVRGGGIDVSTGTFNMYGGEVLRNSTSGSDGGAGGVYINTGGTFNMYSGTISENVASFGGGVLTFGTFKMTGGEFLGNKSSGGSGNDGSDGGGGVYVAYGTFTVGGTAKITGNLKDGAANNVYFRNNQYITLDTPASGMEIYINRTATPSGVFVESGANDTIKGYFHTDDPSKMVALDNGALKLADIQQFYVASYGDDDDNNGLTPETAFATIAKAYGEITSNGKSEILIVDEISTKKVTLGSAKTVTIKSASGTQTVNRGDFGYVFDVKSGDTLILENIIIDGGNKVEGGDYVANSSGHLVNVDDGTLTMNGGAVLQNNTYSGTIGGGVRVYNGTFNMNGGKISGNIAGTMGGGVSASGTFNMSGGEISGNTLTGYNLKGGGVFFSNGTFTMTGGTISDNTLTDTNNLGWGGGVCAANTATFDMSGGTISGNTANYGGGVYIEAGVTLNMSDSPQITGNKKGTATDAPLNNVYLLSGKKINLTGTLDSATRIGVTLASPPTAIGDRVAVTTGERLADTDNFISDDASLNVVDSVSGNVIELQKPALLPVTNTGGTATVTYSSAAIDLTTLASLFTVDENAGARTYTIEAGGTGDGSIGGDNKTLTVTKAGTITIGLVTAATATYAAGTKVTATLTVNKATPSGTWPTLTATYGQALSEISLTSHTALGGVAGAFSWTTPTNKVGNVGAQSHNLTFTPSNTDNYNTVPQDVTVTVSAKAVAFNIDTITAQTYTGNALTPAPVVKDGGTTLTHNTDYTVSYTNNINAGTANVSVTGAGNYAGSTGSTTFTINKAAYGDKTASSTVRAGKATASATLTLPALPSGASYPSSGTASGALISGHSISGTTLKYSTTSQAVGTSATITIPVTNATNYNAYTVTVTITAQNLTDAEKVSDDLDALTFDDIKNANTVPNDITSDLTLIATGKLHGSAIAWSSDKTAVIASNGIVTRQASDTGVILTATVTNGTASVTKIFRLTVTANPPTTGNIGGIVTDSGNSPKPDLAVKIMIGGSTNGTVVGSTATNEQGEYSFNNLPYAVYSLVVEDGTNTVTRLIIINKANVEENVTMPDGNQNTYVEVNGGDTPSVAVENLEAMFTQDDIFAAQTGSVEIKLIVEAVDAPKNSQDAEKVAEKLADKQLGFYLDAELIKTISGTGTSADGTTNIQPPDGTKLTIVIDIPPELQDLAPYSIIRVHGTDAKIIPATYDSDLHTLTFEADLFSTYALAYTSNNPSPTSPPSSSGGGSSSGSGGGTSTTVSTYWIEVPEAKSMAKSAKEQGADIARSRRAAITGIRKASLAILADAGLRYQHDTVVNNAVQVRVYVDDPAAATKDILVSGYVTGDAVDKTKVIFGKWFPNKVAVISFDQQGDFGMKAEVAAKADLSGMDTGKLYFYSYDKATNKYQRILTEYRIDSKGYLHFATVLAGSIIITDRPLSGDAEPQNPGTGGDDTARNINDLQNPNTGGDGMLTPPTQAQIQPQTSVGALIKAATVDGGILKPESRAVHPTTDSVGGKISDAVVFDLDPPAEIANDKKPNGWLIGGLGALMLLAATVLWTVLPRKDDMMDS